jgi:hypothetical protein
MDSGKETIFDLSLHGYSINQFIEGGKEFFIRGKRVNRNTEL